MKDRYDMVKSVLAPCPITSSHLANISIDAKLSNNCGIRAGYAHKRSKYVNSVRPAFLNIINIMCVHDVLYIMLNNYMNLIGIA